MYNTVKSGDTLHRGDNMKKEKFSVLLRSKGFYLSLLTGILAVVALTFVCVNTLDLNSSDKKLTDLNKQTTQEQAKANTVDNKNKNSIVEERETNQEKQNKQNIADNDTLLENDVVSQQEEDGQTKKQLTESNKEAEEGVTVANQGDKIANELKFDEEAGIMWPVEGNVLLNYSMDQGIYFATLGQYKCNPAMVIDAEVNTEVKSASKAVVTKIEQSEETGLTVTTDIGNGYHAVYGQLKELQVEKGQTINEGSVIGSIAEPTKYYVVEGSNLYFQILKDDESVNPLILLR